MTTNGHQHQMTRTLADLRRTTGLSQSEVARRMGVNQPRISQIERDFPNLHYQVVASYLRALDTAASVAVKDTHVTLDNLTADPRSPGARTNRRSRSAEGIARLTAASATEELPLEQRQPEPGSDDTGREENQRDTESDQADSADRQQP